MPYLGQNVMSFDAIPAFEAYAYVRVDVNENKSIYSPQVYDKTVSHTVNSLAVYNDVLYRALRNISVGEEFTPSHWQKVDGRMLVVFCPWGTQAMANNILAEIQGYAYQPFNADGAILDPAAQLGDGVSVNGVTSVLNAIGTRFSSLCSANISAPQDEEIDHEYPYESKENREITRSIASTRARLTVLTDSITAEVTRATAAEGTLSSRITQTADSVSSEVSRATAAEDSLSSRITQTATEVSSKVSKGSIISEINQSAEQITINANKLNLSGLVTITALGTSGAVTINGGNITADTISADTIKANSWVGLSIGGSNGYLNNSYINTAYIRTLGLPASGTSTLNVRLSSSGVSTDGGSTYTDWDTIKAGGTGTAVFG